MNEYSVKVRFSSGESISFLTTIKEDDPFPELIKNEYLYFDYTLYSDLFWELVATRSSDWAGTAISSRYKDIVNFLVFKSHTQAEGFLGLTVDEAQDKALNSDMSFRRIMEDGQELQHDHNVMEKRVSVYVNNGIVYKAEFF